MSTTSVAPVSDELDDRAPGEGFVLAAALGATMAGVAHLLAVPQHWDVSVPMSAFFIILGVAQLVLAAALRWRPPNSVLIVTIAVHLVVMALYLASRTVDLPFVPPHDAGHRVDHLPVAGGVGNGIPIYPGARVEPVGMLDVVCLGAELLLVVALTSLLPSRVRGRVTTVLAAAAVLSVLWRVWVLS